MVGILVNRGACNLGRGWVTMYTLSDLTLYTLMANLGRGWVTMYTYYPT